MEEYSIIGKSLPKVDAVAKATGKAIYADDLKLPRMLTGKMLRSPYSHARIINIDTTKAEKLLGVKAVITGKDVNRRKIGVVEAYRDIWDQESLCLNKVRYIGDEVAAVAAIDEDTALEALELIHVEYEELPAVFDPEEAMKPGAPVIHEGFKNNISIQTIIESGDVERGFRDSYRVFEERFETQCVVHCCLEPHVSVARYLDGQLTLWTSTQIPFGIQKPLARVLDLPADRVRVITMAVGGGFGSKLEPFPMDVCCALLSIKTGCPVKINLNRKEEFETTRTRHPMIIELKTGVKRDGTILAKQARNILDGGAYSGSGIPAAFLSTLFLSLPYKIPNIKMEALRVYTNKSGAGAMRGYTAPQVHFADDSHMDIIADELGIDPLELRKKNAITPGYQTASGLKINSCAFTDTIDKISRNIGWREKRGKLKKENRGVGVGCSGFISGVGLAVSGSPVNYTSMAIIKLHTEGFATVYTGACDIGQGSTTVLSMIAAEELGISPDKVRMVTADTEITPFDAGTCGSRVTFHAGNAIRRAAADAKAQLVAVVAEKLEANPDDLASKGGRIYLVDNPDIGMNFEDAIWAYQEKNGGMEVVGRGVYRHDIEPSVYTTGIGNYAPAYTFSTGGAEVKVDLETGQVEVLKFKFAHDIGRAINPNSVRAQLEGSICMGLGYALFEQILFEKGRMLNPTFLDYKVPTALDMPETEIILVESEEPDAPFGAKECGEGSVAPVSPAIANAVCDATGVRIKNLPLTPEKILRAFKKIG